MVRLIREATRRLEKQPEVGAVVTDWAVQRRIHRVLREIHVFSYRIIYGVQEDDVHIVAVIHAARRLTVEMMGE